jgi:excisionase family DNA binding protein
MEGCGLRVAASIEIEGGLNDMSDLLTIKEAAAVARTTEAAMREKWRRMRLPVVRFGRSVRIEREELERQLKREEARG